ncbi:hypothetical protein DAEQUDRAFT_720319 [Daedalea quercina L-15889]|uniref:Tethering factor for nuclear proteasome STS1 n=1 Tax=Daedalea quercina L-15889 TaxID=1314783 RepID=A0A165ULP6_9APHY|nr:hypothetical protein DAEQUDRAFT_720319 [Daedalea quercina L-15889]
MANVVTHPHVQVDFPRPVNPSHAPLGFGFGLSTTPAMAGWAATPSHTPQSSWNLATNTPSAAPRPQKRRHEPDEESENRHSRDDEMDRSPTPERPKRSVPKRARTTPAVSNTKDEKNSKANRSSPAGDENDVDVGVLLASLPPQSLLPLLTSLLVSQPSLKSTVLSLIPRPTLETATQALDNAANQLRDAYPYSNTPFSQAGPSTSFGFGSGGFGNNRSNSQSASGFGLGRPASTSAFGSHSSSSQSGGMRDEYILSRLRPHINDFIAACQSYLPYFSYVAVPTTTTSNVSAPSKTHAAALQSQHKDRSHPTETFLFLSSLTAHVLNQPPLTQSALVPMILPRLIEEWKAWLDRVDQVVNREGGMFGSETVRTWERCLDEFAQAQGNGLEILKQLRNHWVLRVGWLVGRQPMQEL